jgi:outer membrane protein assembly factor BamB
VVGKNHSTFAVDLRTGKPVWHYPVGGDASPAIAGGILYVGAEDGGVYAIDAATGTLRWLYPTGRPIRGSPAIADGVLYVPSGLTLFALDAVNGQERWKYPVGDTIGGSPAVVDGVVYVGDTSGYLYALAGDGDATGAESRRPGDSR